MKYLVSLVLAAVAFGQSPQPAFPIDPGMYVEVSGGFIKIIGQISQFKRTGSLFASDVTAGIKSQKINIQLLGAHAQTFVSQQPVFYFIPAKQEADAGVNAGDLILIKLEEKSKRRQFEISAHGLWRASSGISLTHQMQLLRSEVKTEVYKVVPAAQLSRGEYALYLSRGEGMAAYVYDFSVEGTALITAREISPANVAVAPITPPAPAASPRLREATPHLQAFNDSSIGAFAEGNPDVRHDGLTLTALTPGGPADQAGMKAGDVILAINDRYLFTIRELLEEISHHPPGSQIAVRYRRYTTIYDTSLVVTQAQ